MTDHSASPSASINSESPLSRQGRGAGGEGRPSPPFIPGLELSRRFYSEVVAPLLAQHAPQLEYAAARLGSGSDVLGFDTAMSTDHDWGPAVNLFVRDQDLDHADRLSALLAEHLPRTFLGYSVGFQEAADEPGTLVMAPAAGGPLQHRVTISSVRQFAERYLAYTPDQPLSAADWLTIPSQQLLGITAGAVFWDQPGELTELRQRMDYYPHDVWLYLLASGWQRLAQEEHLMPRAGFAGDELGSALIGSRLVRDVMSLGFLIEKRYAPYPKWFGSGFQQLHCAGELSPLLLQAQQAATWQDREAALAQCYQLLARLHNSLGLTPALADQIVPFFGRPFKVLFAGRFADAIREEIRDPEVQRIATKGLIGSIDQWSDSTDLRSYPAWRLKLRQIYD